MSGIGLTGATVGFNGANAQILSQTDTSILVVAPVSTTGPVRAFSSNGFSNTKTFTYTGGGGSPNITSLNPSTGGIGSTVSVNGTNFGATQGTSTVTFNGIQASVTSWSTTAIVVSVPTGATTGPVIVTVGGVASNSVTFTVTTPSFGGIPGPLGQLFIPGQNFQTATIFTLDPTNFNDQQNGSFYNWKVEDVIAGRTPTVSRVILSYRDLGVAQITVTLSGVTGPNDANQPNTPTNISQLVTIGTANATQKLCTIVIGLTLTASNLQVSVTRAPGQGPVSITKARLEGTVETTTY